MYTCVLWCTEESSVGNEFASENRPFARRIDNEKMKKKTKPMTTVESFDRGGSCAALATVERNAGGTSGTDRKMIKYNNISYRIYYLIYF